MTACTRRQDELIAKITHLADTEAASLKELIESVESGSHSNVSKLYSTIKSVESQPNPTFVNYELDVTSILSIFLV
jgi:hypothetical protein